MHVQGAQIQLVEPPVGFQCPDLWGIKSLRQLNCLAPTNEFLSNNGNMWIHVVNSRKTRWMNGEFWETFGRQLEDLLLKAKSSKKKAVLRLCPNGERHLVFFFRVFVFKDWKVCLKCLSPLLFPKELQKTSKPQDKDISERFNSAETSNVHALNFGIESSWALFSWLPFRASARASWGTVCQENSLFYVCTMRVRIA